MEGGRGLTSKTHVIKYNSWEERERGGDSGTRGGDRRRRERNSEERVGGTVEKDEE